MWQIFSNFVAFSEYLNFTYVEDKKGDFAVLIIEVERKERNLLRLDDSFLLYYAWQARCQIAIFGFIHLERNSPLQDF